jgi:alkanesulfonate monooxygenase SsuD/methylene tetrahydromethanopterin reductase-like flavin-dependent oxidoreductase (luciferase family)
VVKVGLFLPREGMSGGRDRAGALLARMEREGIDHVGVADHVSFHTGWGQDGIVEAGMLAMLCNLPVYVGVYLLALRHPVTVARQLAQVAQHAPGRLILGIGVGGEDRHEVEICGVDPATRGRRTDESMAILRGLMTGEPFSFAGRFFQLDRARITPAPEKPIPLTVGGRDPRALERAGRLGDGWLGIWSTVERFQERVAAVELTAARAGRSAVAWQHGLQLWCGFGPDRETARARVAGAMEDLYRIPFERFERFSPYGSPDEVAAYLRPYVEAGCEWLNVSAQGGPAEESIEAAGEVARLLRRP